MFPGVEGRRSFFTPHRGVLHPSYSLCLPRVGQPGPSGSPHPQGSDIRMPCSSRFKLRHAESSLKLAVWSDFTKDLRKGDAQISVCPSALTHRTACSPRKEEPPCIKLGSGPFLKTPLSYCSLYSMVNCTPWCSWRWLGQDGAT